MVSPFVTGFIGWMAGGPIGGLIGAGAAVLWNKLSAAAQQQNLRDTPPPPPPPHSARASSSGGGGASSSQTRYSSASSAPADFLLSFMILVAAVMKADGRATRDELDVVKRFLSENYPKNLALDALSALRDLLRKDIPVGPVSAQIAAHFSIAARRELLHMLFAVAYADNICTPDERRLLFLIGSALRLSLIDISTIAAIFTAQNPNASSGAYSSSGRQQSRPSRPATPPIENDYAILGIPSSATDQDVKKAYRRMAQKHHPDKVAHLGPAAQAQATKKFLAIQQAYDRIRAARHL